MQNIIDYSENCARMYTKEVIMEIGIHNQILENDTNIVHLVETIFSRALQLGVSDIHIEPVGEYTRVRVRLDGLLKELCRVPIVRHNGIVSRIKLLSEMDIAEKRLPQDGRLSAKFQERDIDMRIASLPTMEGEKLAIRILDKNTSLMSLESLDFSEKNLQEYKKLIRAANGLVLVTGPTGSGKTTTLYATLNEINSEDRNVVTIEDPVEYQLPGANQVAINKKIGLDFATGLRALMRQDPNIIMLGEIRDQVSASIAVQAALTGHMVFSTLHTNSSLGAISRLIDMGIEPFLLLSGLRGVVAQRLVRRVCPFCKKAYKASVLERSYLGIKEDLELMRGSGCSYCFGTGYRGRVAIHELLTLDDKLSTMIMRKEEESAQLQYIRAKGGQTLKEDGIIKAMQGITTVEELLRTAIVE